MTTYGFTYDACDAEWENPNTGRTVWTSADDSDDYCEGCDSTVVYAGDDDTIGTCNCDGGRP
jgi:hypothetical protein